MKITNLKMYGIKPKTFAVTIEGYSHEDPDIILKDKLAIMICNILGVSGYDNEKINNQEDIEIMEFRRFDEEDFILCTINILNLQASVEKETNDFITKIAMKCRKTGVNIMLSLKKINLRKRYENMDKDIIKFSARLGLFIYVISLNFTKLFKGREMATDLTADLIGGLVFIAMSVITAFLCLQNNNRA